MVLTSFKTELEAFSTPPKFLFFHWTLENFGDRAGALQLSAGSPSTRSSSPLGSTLLGLLFAVPAAWAMAFAPGKRTKDVLLWMLSTKMMPPVGALIPIYLLFKNTGLLDTRGGLIAVRLPDQPADHRLDALHLFQGDPGRDPGGRAHGWRHAVARRSSMC